MKVDLFHVRAGSGDPPIVFVPGWCCDHTFFEPQFEHFKSSHTVVAVDPRGCGRSDRPETGYDIPMLADDLARLVDELGLAPPVIVGHSLGGMIGVELAARRPSMPLAVVACDPGPIDPLPETRTFYQRFAIDLAGPDGEAVRREYVEQVAGPTIAEPWRKRVLETMCAAPLDAAAAVIRGLDDWNGAVALARCDVPVLVLLATPRGSNAPDRLLGLKPDVHIGITVGSGHFHQFEVPEQVTPMIERFIRVTAP